MQGLKRYLSLIIMYLILDIFLFYIFILFDLLKNLTIEFGELKSHNFEIQEIKIAYANSNIMST